MRPAEHRGVDIYFSDETARPKNNTMVPRETWKDVENIQIFSIGSKQVLIRNKVTGDSYRAIVDPAHVPGEKPGDQKSSKKKTGSPKVKAKPPSEKDEIKAMKEDMKEIKRPPTGGSAGSSGDTRGPSAYVTGLGKKLGEPIIVRPGGGAGTSADSGAAQVDGEGEGGNLAGLSGPFPHAGRVPLVKEPGGGFASWTPQLTVEERMGEGMARRVFTSFPSFTAFGESTITSYRLEENT